MANNNTSITYGYERLFEQFERNNESFYEKCGNMFLEYNTETSSIPNCDYEVNFTMYETSAIPLVKQPAYLIAVYSVAYGLVFLAGLIGNGFVIAVIYKDPSMRNVTNYFILNLAVADILVTFLCVPITLLTNIFTGKDIHRHKIKSFDW